AVGPLRQDPRGVPPVRSGRHGGCRTPVVRGQTHFRWGNLELPYSWRPGPFHAGAPEPGSAARHASAANTSPAAARHPTDSGTFGSWTHHVTPPQNGQHPKSDGQGNGKKTEMTRRAASRSLKKAPS